MASRDTKVKYSNNTGEVSKTHLKAWYLKFRFEYFYIYNTAKVKFTSTQAKKLKFSTNYILMCS